MSSSSRRPASISTVPDLRRLFTPHVNRIRSCLEPGLAEVTWTNFEWQEFTERCLTDIDDFSYLMSRANDIYANRIEKLLLAMNSIKLHALPEQQPWTLDKFLQEIKVTCR
jgi:dynein heavy chain